MNVLSACMSVHHVHIWCPRTSKEVIKSLRTGANDCCEVLCGYWDPNPGPLEVKPVLLTTSPSLQSQYLDILHSIYEQYYVLM